MGHERVGLRGAVIASMGGDKLEGEIYQNTVCLKMFKTT